MCPIALARVAKLFVFEAFFCAAGTPPLSFSDFDLTRSLASTHAFWSPFGVLFVLFCVRAAVFVSAPMLVLVACLIHCFFGGLALVWHFLACFCVQLATIVLMHGEGPSFVHSTFSEA